MDYDEELHKAWVTKALHLAMEYREAEPGREVRDAMRAMKAHFEGRPASMPMPEDATRTAAGSPLDRPVGPVAGA